MGFGLQGCRSPLLRYSMPSAAEGEFGPSEVDRLLAKEIEKLSPPSLDKPLKAITVVAPDYPQWISRVHSGSVLIRFTINPQGLVTGVTPRPDDNPELVRLMTEALETWRFEPPLRDGKPTSVRMNLPFRFAVQ